MFANDARLTGKLKLVYTINTSFTFQVEPHRNLVDGSFSFHWLVMGFNVGQVYSQLRIVIKQLLTKPPTAGTNGVRLARLPYVVDWTDKHHVASIIHSDDWRNA